MANRSTHETDAPAAAAAAAAATTWNNAAAGQHISNDSSLGGDEFYDAVEDVSSRTQRASGVSSGYGSNRSARMRSSSAGTLVPNAEAAELMKVVASTNSSVMLDVSAFATPGEYPEEGPGVSSLGLDGSHGASRSKNPFAAGGGGGGGGGAAENATSSAAAAAETRRLWLSAGRPQPAKMVVVDISSAENTPATTPVNTPGGGVGGSAGGGAGSASLLPPRPPPKGDTTTAASLNPFAEEEEPRSPASPNTNPFVTASSTLNPFADDMLQPQDGSADGGDGNTNTNTGTGSPKREEPPPPSASAGPGTAVSSAPTRGDAGVPEAVRPAVTAAARASSAESNHNPQKPPPLPPRRVASPSPAKQRPPHPPPRSRATTGEGGGECSGTVSPRSMGSIATCDSSGGRLEGSEGGVDADAGSVGSSTGSDGTAGGKPKKKYMVVNKVSPRRW